MTFCSINISLYGSNNSQIESIEERKGERQQTEMEQAREEAHQQQMQPQNPLLCPRCSSLDTRFRYFNNNSHTQPRHYCRTCKRQWTVGGKLRHIPIGGSTRNGKPTKASSSKGGNSRSQPLQPLLPLGEGHRQNLSLLVTAMVSKLLEATFFHMAIPREQNVQTTTRQQALSQQNPIAFESYQTHNEAMNAPPSHLNINRVVQVQPGWSMNSLPQDITYGSSFAMANACLQNNFSGDTGDTTDREDTAYVNVDEWLNLPGCDTP